MLRLHRRTLVLLSLFVFLLICYRYYYWDTIFSLDLNDYTLIDRGGYNSFDFGLSYLDDSSKFEKYLREDISLLIFHGGVLIETIAFLPKKIGLSGDYLIYSIFSINLLMVLELYNVIKDKVDWRWHIISLPFFVSLVFTVNKEITTIFCLLFYSPLFDGERISSINWKNLLGIFKGIIKIIIMSLASISLVLGRPSLVLIFTILLLTLKTLKVFISFSLKRISTKSILLIASIIFLGIFLFLKIDVDFFMLLTSWLESESVSKISLVERFISIPYSITVPFPISIINLNRFTGEFNLLNYMLITNIFLSILGVFRGLFWVKRLFRGPTYILSDALRNEYIYCLLITTFIVGLRVEEVTRQLLTLQIPMTYLLLSIYSDDSINRARIS